MNWITRCPECVTVYQVVPDQLKQAKGWLRCGHCSHVFDSTGRVLAWQGVAGNSPEFRQSIDVKSSVASAPQLQDTSPQTPVSLNDSVSTASATDPSPDHLFPVEPEAEKVSSGESTDTIGKPVPIFSPLVLAEPPAQLPTSPVQARGPWRVLSLGLVLTLTLQWLWLQRGVVVSVFPQLEMAFQSVCQVTGCESAVVRNPDAMVIDSSSFVKLKDGFVLHWTVRNSSHQTLGMTALELSLKDGQDSDLVRRVLLPKDMEAPPTIAAGQTWSGMLILGVSDNLPVVGYRVLSFYP
ncbi:zinc-ribbon and DUF3426 domain-containing protein [Limnohabitans sp. DM1]|uniref:zinc-ribbon and DUF3426 domain-containing protein n=1 Tax=Limnohabitans sp. DM1 TaxID=1597955 RepID=UPI000B2FCA39|nr:zinc-ribbon and DUF3426 domain-containing protein [Limnohabitans sp. DM1]